MIDNLLQLTRLIFGDILVMWFNTEVVKWLFGFICVAFVIKFVTSLLKF